MLINKESLLSKLDGRPPDAMISVATVKRMVYEEPSIETIYGYHFNELAFVASILAKEGVSPTELIRIIWDAERIAEILCKEIKDNFQKAMKGYMEGVEDERV